jgi:5-methylcytosine-specific restriction protein A
VRQLYQTARWRRRSKAFLRRVANVLCVWCQAEGLTTAATTVDHEPPHHGDVTLFWDESTWRGACRSCNSARANRDRRGERRVVA